MKALSASGALETLVELQRATSEMAANLEGLKAKIDERKRFDRRKDELTANIGGARTLLKQDLDQRRSLVDEAIELFAEYTRALYGKSARLGVDVKDSGYKFTFAIDRQGSDGVDQMVVFCFDLMVATLRARRTVTLPPDAKPRDAAQTPRRRRGAGQARETDHGAFRGTGCVDRRDDGVRRR